VHRALIFTIALRMASKQAFQTILRPVEKLILEFNFTHSKCRYWAYHLESSNSATSLQEVKYLMS
jgi:hypothetical protein